jgi:hypothetical protein
MRDVPGLDNHLQRPTKPRGCSLSDINAPQLSVADLLGTTRHQLPHRPLDVRDDGTGPGIRRIAGHLDPR